METLREILNSKSNYFSSLEELFRQTTGQELLSPSNWQFSDLKKGISIVIPTYNSNDTLHKTLLSIEKQIDSQLEDKVEVVVADDASIDPAFDVCQDFTGRLDINYIRQNRNLGAGPTRRNGVKVARHENILFLDSDVILSQGLIKNHFFVHNILPDQVLLVSFQETAEPTDARFAGGYTLKASEMDTLNRDFRRKITVRAEWEPPKELVGRSFQLLEETSNFKDFGEGRKVGLWTLPMMALTLCMSASKKALIETGGTPEGLKGWGWNDTAVAARLIGWGLYLVPNINSAVLQFKHPIRHGDFQNKRKSFFYNQAVYENMLDCEFAVHKTRSEVPM